MYFCGLKGMMPGIQDARRRVRPRLTSLRPRNPSARWRVTFPRPQMLKEVCRKKGKTYDDFVADLKKKGQWRVEVY